MKLLKLICISLLVSSNSHASDFLIGVGVHPNINNLSSDQTIRIMKDIGFNSIRLDYLWSNIEKQKGVFSTGDPIIEEILKNSSGNKIQPLVILGGSNNLYYSDYPKTNQDISYFTTYSKYVVKHFTGKVKYYEIWNEWSIKNGHSESSAYAYFNLVKATYRAIKKMDPDAVVIAGGFNPTRQDEMLWAKQLVKLGILDYVDGLSLHTYLHQEYKTPIVNENLKSIVDMEASFKALRGSEKNIPVYITEIGIPTESYYHHMHFNNDFIANFAQKYIVAASNITFIKGVWWYDLVNDGSDRKNPEDNFGMYTEKYQPKKIIKSMKNAIQQIK